MKKQKIILAVLLLVTIVMLALIFLRPQNFAYSGVIEAVEVDVSSRLNDIITKLHVDEGSPVVKDGLLAELENKEPNLAYEISLKEFKRAEQLLKTSAGSKENYDLKKNRYQQALIKKQWGEIKSPIDGKVLYKYYEEGEFVPAGRKILTVADLSKVNAWVYVEHDKLADISPGQEVTGYLPEINKNFKGKVLVLNDEAEFTPKNVQTKQERTRLVYGIKIAFDNNDKFTLKPGMTIEVNFDKK
ncbi:MAG: HlyD family efflux transporter periplasmic adaptor subunit [Endomicrobiaceae bacterium]|nr:HlyD family efflux transporter periplasmic adaptor subunit [Endomicrobiaceae bacterium]